MKYLRLFALLVIPALLSNCSNAPEACFVPSTTVAEKGEEIIFDECSLFGDSWSWDFGDGNTSTTPDPRYAFSAVGEYLVVLTYSKGGTRPDSHSEIIKVGNRKLTYINVAQLPADNGGTPWDPGDNADPVLYMKPTSGSTWNLTTPVNTNLSNSTPFLWDMSANAYEFTYDSWDFMLLDDDGGTSDTIGTWTIDLDTVYVNRFIPLTGTDLSLEVRYSLF